MENKFSKKLKELRTKAGYSQSELHLRVFGKKSNTTVSNWEKGVSKPSFDDFIRLCMFFEVNPNELILDNSYQTIKIDSKKIEEQPTRYAKDDIEALIEENRELKEENRTLLGKLSKAQELVIQLMKGKE